MWRIRSGWIRRIRRVGIRWRSNDDAVARVVLLLLLLLLLVQQILLELLVFLLQITDGLFLARLLGGLPLATHLFGQGIDACDLGGGVGCVGWSSGWWGDVESLYSSRVFGLLFTVMHLTARIDPFINLLGFRDASQEREKCGGSEQGGQLYGIHDRLCLTGTI